MNRSSNSRKRRASLVVAALACAAAACQRQAAATERGDEARECVSDTLAPGRALAGGLSDDRCRLHGGGRYADFALPLQGGRAYLLRVTDRADSSRRHQRARGYDAALFTSGPHPRELLGGTVFDARATGHFDSQLLFIAPATGRYLVRVRGREPADEGEFTLSARSCGGGELPLRVQRAGTLGPSSCLERMRFGDDSGYADLWSIRLAPRERVRVRAMSASHAPLYLRIRGPGVGGDESNGDVDRLVFTAQQGGDYTVLVGQTAYDARPSRYTIRAEELGG